MNVLQLHQRIIGEYEAYTRSFQTVRDPEDVYFLLPLALFWWDREQMR